MDETIKKVIADLKDMVKVAEKALNGDSNDDGHDALYQLSEWLPDSINALKGAAKKRKERHSERAEARDILLTELASHFDSGDALGRDPSLYLAYDRFAVAYGDESDAEGVAQAKSLLPAEFVLQSNV